MRLAPCSILSQIETGSLFDFDSLESGPLFDFVSNRDWPLARFTLSHFKPSFDSRFQLNIKQLIILSRFKTYVRLSQPRATSKYCPALCQVYVPCLNRDVLSRFENPSFTLSHYGAPETGLLTLSRFQTWLRFHLNRNKLFILSRFQTCIRLFQPRATF